MIAIDLTYMWIDLEILGATENLDRYWIMTVICIAVAYLLTQLLLRVIKQGNDHLARQVTVSMSTDYNIYEKRTLEQPHSTEIDLEDDIYAITILAFEILDKRRREEIHLNRQSCLSQNE